MTVSFHIEYRTSWGEEVRLLGSIPELGNNIPQNAIPLTTVDGINWVVAKEIKVPQNKVIEYNYYIYRDGNVVRNEWDNFSRRLYPANRSQQSYKIYDCWKNLPEDLYLYSSAFTESLLAHLDRDKIPESYNNGLIIKAYAPRITSDYCLGICGNQEILGSWNADKAWLMSDVNFPEWQTELDASKLQFPIEYKFVLFNKKTRKAEYWENNPNRHIGHYQFNDNETIVISDRYVYFNVPTWKGAGVAIPVFSLRSESSYGIGDFGDLKKMIDWAVKTDQKFVQILPINDTTMTGSWTDSYPYNSISIYAFHPIYTNIDKLGQLKDKKVAKAFEERRKELNALPMMNYEAVLQTKWEYFRLIFAQEGEAVLASDGFRLFYQANKEWLQPYAAFSYLRDTYKTPNFREWPEQSVYNSKQIDELCRPGTPHYPHVAIYYYIQYNLHLQLLEATTYAREHRVAIKGDIPIGISRNSVEAWTEPYYFNLNGQAGAPPDDFSVNGQNWGFPTYNWDVMAQDGYKWWMKRFHKMAEYFDAYRIDHILGFFRIWEIPMNAVHGLLGQFAPALPMTAEEIESYGLQFRKDFFLNPYIHESFLEQVFGPHTEYVKEHFIEPTDVWQVYRMHPDFDTQRKVETYFADKNDTDSIWIRDGLYSLISNVLFVVDKDDPEKFHPRISAQHDFLYKSLSDWDKNSFNRLYDQYYYHRHNQFWHRQAMQKLPQLTLSTRMLVCGEDLGMIPDSVPWVMNDLRILSLEIQRMPKNPNYEFGHLNEYPYRSVCTISTHDMSTLRGWWEEDYAQTQRYYNNIMGHYGTAPTVASPEICEEIVRNHLYSNSILCILALQDWMSIDEELRYPNVPDERINVPANPKHYWRYRMHLTIEELMKADNLNDKIKNMIKNTGRNPEK
ncbi:4-alpha-glucanotransferase [Bacteroides sp. 519]|uniref:4-alpha-glucanotransferase n=1 Tax=Bacteroides sp. 519 TaxID=2302937 RepID=UPI0013D487BD|nr:4-alpha-glucanotransferase [Bacteroides sp. 519]NDV59280.1 4-alpha-glucanotransferase [Bacteroides sp. 519]